MDTSPIAVFASLASAASFYGRPTAKSSSKPRRTYRLQHNHGQPIVNTGPKARRNDPCPCGATYADGRPKKYKDCHGKPRQAPIALAPAAPVATTQGQEPVSGIHPLEAVVVAMQKAGMAGELIYAYQQVGLLVTDANRSAHHPDVIRAWDEAIAKYREDHPADKEVSDAPTTTDVAEMPPEASGGETVPEAPAGVPDRAESPQASADEPAPEAADRPCDGPAL